jgi:hypothetical protein
LAEIVIVSLIISQALLNNVEVIVLEKTSDKQCYLVIKIPLMGDPENKVAICLL